MTRRCAFVVCSGVALLALLLVACAALAEGRSDGLLGSCDLTPQVLTMQFVAAATAPKVLLPNGFFGQNKTVGYGNFLTFQMNWVALPEPSSAYTLRSGDGSNPNTDPTTYVPGVPMDIHLRVTVINYIHVGLLLYATNSTGLIVNDPLKSNPKNVRENHLGAWQVRQADPYQLPTSCVDNSKLLPPSATVTHSDAAPKPVHTKFTWTGPVGGGTVRFRVLLKFDNQGRGKFFYPVKELVLREGKAAATNPKLQQTVIGDLGTNCADVCWKKTPLTPYCNAAAMTALQSDKQLTAVLKNGLNLRSPSLAGCAYAGAPQIRADGYAQFRSPDIAATCPVSVQQQRGAVMPDVCYSSVLSTSQPICICSPDSMVQTKNPFADTTAAVSAASRTIMSTSDDEDAMEIVSVQADSDARSAAAPRAAAMNAIVALTITAALASRSSGRVLLLLCASICALLLCTPVHGHNWVQSQHRATTASVNKPCQERIGNQPHVQVVPGQTFEIEFTGGHGQAAMAGRPPPFMFAVIAEKDYDQLRAKNITDILKDYVNLAPDSARYDQDLHYQRHHIHFSKVPSGRPECWEDPKAVNKTYPCGDYWMEPFINATTYSEYIVREPFYQATAMKYKEGSLNPGFGITQRRFKQEYLTGDRRVNYASAKYPWLESVSIFPHIYAEESTFTSQSDIFRERILARAGTSRNYIVYYAWGSYSDCVDVNVQPSSPGKAGFTSAGQIVNRYGTGTDTGGAGEIVRLDHCEIRYVSYASTPCRRMNSSLDASACVKDCTARKCLIGIVPVKNAPGTLPIAPNIPFTQKADSGVCSGISVAAREAAGCPVVAKNNQCDPASLGTLKDDDFICYTAAVFKDQDGGVEEDHKIVTDPVDPAWYSSCIFSRPAGGFVNIPKLTYVPPEWQMGEQCVDCAFQKGLTSLQSTIHPDWAEALNPMCADCDLRNSATSVTAQQLAGTNNKVAGAPYVPRPASSSTGAASSAKSSSSGSSRPSSRSSSSTGRAATSQGAEGGPNADPVNGGSSDTDSDSNSNSNSSSSSITSKPLYLGLIIGGAVLLVVAAAAVVALVLKRRAAAHAGKMAHMTSALAASSTELTANPAAFNSW